jgi:hypothetical protein
MKSSNKTSNPRSAAHSRNDAIIVTKLYKRRGVFSPSKSLLLICAFFLVNQKRGRLHFFFRRSESCYAKEMYRIVSQAYRRRAASFSTGYSYVVSFYQYRRVSETDVITLREQILRDWTLWSIKGRIYLSQEGINAQMMLPCENLSMFRCYMEEKTPFRGLILNPAIEHGIAFDRLHVRLRQQLVADGLLDFQVTPNLEPDYLSPEKFHEQIEKLDSESVLLDIRNHYER